MEVGNCSGMQMAGEVENSIKIKDENGRLVLEEAEI